MSELDEGALNMRLFNMRIFAHEKAFYHGHAIAAVAATDPNIAEEALNRIQVDYQVLPAVMDMRKAMEAGAPILIPELRTTGPGGRGTEPTNIARHSRFLLGDPAEGFKAATHIVEREFSTATVHQGYIEPQNALGLYHADGTVTVWCSTQGSFLARRRIAEVLRIPASKIRVIPTEIGGGFGGKILVYLEPIAVLLSKKSGYRPVKLWMGRTDVFIGTGPAPGTFIRAKMGVDNNGRITAATAELIYEDGAFPRASIPEPAVTMFAPYNIPNIQIDGYDVVVNKPTMTPYRSPGAPMAAFAVESVIDEIAEVLEVDPIEFRERNAAREGTQRVDGHTYSRIGFQETLEVAKNHPHYSAPLGPNQGRGVASGFWLNVGGVSSASALVNADGSISLIVGTVDIGGSRASIAMQLAETLGLDTYDIKPQVADTETVGYNDHTGGSRTTFATGWAAYELGQQLKQRLVERVAQLWELPETEVKYDGGVFSAERKRITLKELSGKLQAVGGPIGVSVTVTPAGVGYGFATHIVDVEVDPETGKVEILRYTAVQDVGKAVHPSYVEGQMQGGVAQGVGLALSEEYVYDDKGILLNSSFLDYRMPVCPDLPMIETVLVEVPNPGHPYGVRGAGEVPIVPPPAAIANAIFRAIGVRMNHLPMTPGRIVAAMQASKTRP
jgi:CO/xanthine dehydrogenase Mo-binding subunit